MKTTRKPQKKMAVHKTKSINSLSISSADSLPQDLFARLAQTLQSVKTDSPYAKAKRHNVQVYFLELFCL